MAAGVPADASGRQEAQKLCLADGKKKDGRKRAARTAKEQKKWRQDFLKHVAVFFREEVEKTQKTAKER